ncbi:MAG: DUF2849 domain-containing protein [Pseudomonadota bacterium]
MKAVTANLLTNGRVVYLGADGQWVERLADAMLFEGEGADTALAEASKRSREIADIYLIEVGEHGNAAGREAIRETIRNAGPTVRTDLGKQAGNDPALLTEIVLGDGAPTIASGSI